MRFNKIFYTIKPLIPRKLQISLRRQMVTYKRKKYSHIWPIDPDSTSPPSGWRGWPENKKFALIISHDVDTQEGHDKCYQLMELEERLGFRSSFNIVPEKYRVSENLIQDLKNRGFEVGVHGLNHDGKLFFSRKIFDHRAKQINGYFQKWGTTGFASPSMLCNLNWMLALKMTHSTSTYDSDPFEPQQNPVKTIFPFWVQNKGCPGIDQKGAFPQGLTGFVELPYTLPQDFTLFILMKEQTIHIWKKKLDWIAQRGGMALFNSHPCYMNFNEQKNGPEEYSVEYYTEFLEYIKDRYKDQYWHVLPRDMARFWQQNYTQD